MKAHFSKLLASLLHAMNRKDVKVTFDQPVAVVSKEKKRKEKIHFKEGGT